MNLVYFTKFCIEGHPLITRFKTIVRNVDFVIFPVGIEGHPFITRFKTEIDKVNVFPAIGSIEGHPFITRFKTDLCYLPSKIQSTVLKVIHL